MLKLLYGTIANAAITPASLSRKYIERILGSSQNLQESQLGSHWARSRRHAVSAPAPRKPSGSRPWHLTTAHTILRTEPSSSNRTRYTGQRQYEPQQNFQRLSPYFIYPWEESTAKCSLGPDAYLLWGKEGEQVFHTCGFHTPPSGTSTSFWIIQQGGIIQLEK